MPKKHCVGIGPPPCVLGIGEGGRIFTSAVALWRALRGFVSRLSYALQWFRARRAQAVICSISLYAEKPWWCRICFGIAVRFPNNVFGIGVWRCLWGFCRNGRSDLLTFLWPFFSIAMSDFFHVATYTRRQPFFVGPTIFAGHAIVLTYHCNVARQSASIMERGQQWKAEKDRGRHQLFVRKHIYAVNPMQSRPPMPVTNQYEWCNETRCKCTENHFEWQATWLHFLQGQVNSIDHKQVVRIHHERAFVHVCAGLCCEPFFSFQIRLVSKSVSELCSDFFAELSLCWAMLCTCWVHSCWPRNSERNVSIALSAVWGSWSLVPRSVPTHHAWKPLRNSLDFPAFAYHLRRLWPPDWHRYRVTFFELLSFFFLNLSTATTRNDDLQHDFDSVWRIANFITLSFCFFFEFLFSSFDSIDCFKSVISQTSSSTTACTSQTSSSSLEVLLYLVYHFE